MGVEEVMRLRFEIVYFGLRGGRVWRCSFVISRLNDSVKGNALV